MSEKKVLSIVTKTLIKNVIRHTDSHNKVVEESEMWRQRDKETERTESRSSTYSFLKDRGADMRYEFPSSRDRRAHMDEEPHGSYWMNELYKAEEADDNRWGHSGYKAMYPERFSRSNSSSSDKRTRRHKDRHKKNTKVKRKKSRKRKHNDCSDIDTDSADRKKRRKHTFSESEEEQKMKRKKKHKSKEKKSKRKHKKKRHKEDDANSS